MRLSESVQRCLGQFAQSQSRLTAYCNGAIGEIQRGLKGCLLLERGLCRQAAQSAEASQAASAELANRRPGLLFSGRGAVVDLAACFSGEIGESLEALRSRRVPANGGLLWLVHDPALPDDGRVAVVKLRRLHRQRPGDAGDLQQRSFIDWVAALQWLAEAQTASSDEDESDTGDCVEFDDVFDDWELRANCPGLDSLRLVLAPLLTPCTRRRLRRFMPSCAIFLQRLSADEDAGEAESEIGEAVEHGVLLHLDDTQATVALKQSQLRFAIDATVCLDFIETSRGLVDAALRDFVKDSEERRRRLLVDGDWQLDGLLSEQLSQLQRDSLRQLVKSLTALNAVTRGILVKRRSNDFSGQEQRRPQRSFFGDLQRLQESAGKAASSFQRSFESRLGNLSEQIQAHLRQQQVKDRLASAYVAHSLRHPQLSKEQLQRSLMEMVSAELHGWNRHTRILSELDRCIAESRVQHLRALRQQAQCIPELLFCGPSDSFCAPPPPSPTQSSSASTSRAAFEMVGGDEDFEGSLSSQTVISVGIRQLGWQPMRSSVTQSLAVGIGMPLFVPLAAITMAIIWPVSAIRRQPSKRRAPKRRSAHESPEKLRDDAWDYLDKLSKRLHQQKLICAHATLPTAGPSFVDRYCILPEKAPQQTTPQHQLDPSRQLGELENIYVRLQNLIADAKLYGAVQLDASAFNTEVEDAMLIGERIGSTYFSEVFALPQQQPPLALKLIRSNMASSALLEAEMLRELADDPHPNLLPGLGCLYFPRLNRIGLMMPLCKGNLRQLLKQHRKQLVPAVADDPDAVLPVCLGLYQQVLAGVRHLHRLRILHRDLKLENVLVDIGEATGAPGDARLRICDFGFAKNEEAMSGASFAGTKGYLAPELVPPGPHRTCFALGVMLWECYYGTSAPAGSPEFAPALLDGNKSVDFLIRQMTHHAVLERPHVEQCIAMLKVRDWVNGSCGDACLVNYSDSLHA
uniref:Protein kinase domain-containing protein n=1 Tax=Macrostomum lignano TaxID=282301 RepID=A0A1I8GJ48_9PLAT